MQSLAFCSKRLFRSFQQGSTAALQLGSPSRRSPGASNLLAALKACARLRDLETGTRIHGHVVQIQGADAAGRGPDILVANTLVDMYAKCGSIVDSRRVFDAMERHDVVSWTAMIMGYAQQGGAEISLELFLRMQSEGGVIPDGRTYVAVLKACTDLAEKEQGGRIQGKLVKLRSLERGFSIHSQMLKSECAIDVFLASSLVDLYGKCGSLVDARRIFDKTQQRDTVLWTALILAYAENGESSLAMQLFECMGEAGFRPNARTFVAALSACIDQAAEEEARTVDGRMLKVTSLAGGASLHSQLAAAGYESDMFVASKVVDMYAKCGSIGDASRVFERMRNHDVVSWTAMISGHAQCGSGERALELFARMQDEGCVPNSRTFVAVLNACSCLAGFEEGRKVEGKMVKIVALEKGRAIHNQLERAGFQRDLFVASSLVDMYAKCGSMVDARPIFDSLQHPDAPLWSSMIFGYAHSGQGEVALQLFARMQDNGLKPTARAFVAALQACGSLADLETGQKIHAKIRDAKLEVDSSIASALIVFYGKCGGMLEAEQVFDSTVVKDVFIWNALIAGYGHQGDAKRVLELFEKMQKERIRPNAVTFLSVLIVCSHAGLVDVGKEYFLLMIKDFGMKASMEHYGCLIDLLGRANHLDEAISIVRRMPFEPNVTIWKTILGAARKWKNVEVARLAFDSVVRLDSADAAVFALMSSTYAAAGMWEESTRIKETARHGRVWRKPAESWWIDSYGKVHRFVIGDTLHPQTEQIMAKLKEVMVKMRAHGYVPQLENVLRTDLSSDDQKESILCGHSERLAIGCALINTAAGTTIRIAKSLRACEDCHRATAIISKVEQRVVVCRDASRFHVFKDGNCSCGDFW